MGMMRMVALVNPTNDEDDEAQEIQVDHGMQEPRSKNKQQMSRTVKTTQMQVLVVRRTAATVCIEQQLSINIYLGLT